MTHPYGPPPGPAEVRARATALFGEGAVPTPPAAADVAEPPALPWRTRCRLALRERLPLWLRLRCAVEPRTLAALTVLLVLAGGFGAYHFWTGRPRDVRAPAAEPVPAAHRSVPPAPMGAAPGAPSGPASSGAAERGVVVDVSGKVRKPGIHRLPAGSRVADALRAAGGVRSGTDTAALNQARVLADGEQIVVGGPAATPPQPGGTAGSAGPVSGPISLSAATVEQLDTLPGVGPVLAQHILDFRTRNGGYTSVDQLREVKGIGPKRFDDIRPLVQP